MTRILLIVALVVATGGCAAVDAIDRLTLPPIPERCDWYAQGYGEQHFDHPPPKCTRVEFDHCGGWDPVCEQCGLASGCVKVADGVCTVLYIDEWTRRHELCHLYGDS